MHTTHSHTQIIDSQSYTNTRLTTSNPPSRSKKTLSPSRDLLLLCCVRPSLPPYDLLLRVHPSAVAKCHRSAAENPSVICCSGHRSAAPRPKPTTWPEFLPFVFWILKLSWYIWLLHSKLTFSIWFL